MNICQKILQSSHELNLLIINNCGFNIHSKLQQLAHLNKEVQLTYLLTHIWACIPDQDNKGYKELEILLEI